jgi:hypothetical protein
MTSLLNVDAPEARRPRSGPFGGIPSPTPLWGGTTDPGENHEPDET